MEIEEAVQLKDVTYYYPLTGTSSLKHVSLNIHKGEVILLAGASGSGKSTILRLINGLAISDEGSRMKGDVWIEGNNIKNLKTYEISNIVGTVFQNPKSQFFNLDTTDEILFGLENRGASYEEMEKGLKKTAEDLRLQELLDRNIFYMSGGNVVNLSRKPSNHAGFPAFSHV